MYAVVQTGGKQYRVSKGDIINVEKLNVEAGSRVLLDEVIALGGEKTVVGKPFVEGAAIDCQVIENGKAKKVIIYKYKAKKDYRKKQGHRQPYTQLEVLDILTDGAKPSATPAKKEEPKQAATEKKTPSLKSMKKAELIEFAKENNIAIDEKATNAEMIAAIEAGLK